MFEKGKTLRKKEEVRVMKEKESKRNRLWVDAEQERKTESEEKEDWGKMKRKKVLKEQGLIR